MSTPLASIILTAEQVLSFANAVNTLIGLLAKIQASNPDAWAEVSGDYATAVTAWRAITNPAQQGTTTGTVEATANAAGTVADSPKV